MTSKQCVYPGCHERIRHGAYCTHHKAKQRQTFDDRRGSSTDRGYDYRWQRARAAFLLLNPLCVMCEAKGRTTAASVVDHIVPHKGDEILFWDSANWQPLCRACHDSDKRRLELSGTVKGSNADGSPVDPSHHWNK